MTWTKNSLQIPPHVKLRDNNVTLIIENSTIEDDGTYTCTAANRQGRDVSSAKVTIEGKLNCKSRDLRKMVKVIGNRETG